MVTEVNRLKNDIKSLHRVVEEMRGQLEDRVRANQQMKRVIGQQTRDLKERDAHYTNIVEDLLTDTEARDKWTMEAIQKIEEWKNNWKNEFGDLEKKMSDQIDAAHDTDNVDLEDLLKDLIRQFRKMPDILDKTKEGLKPPAPFQRPA